MRGGSGSTDRIVVDVDAIDAALAGHPVPDTIMVERGTNLAHITNNPLQMVGQTYSDKAYLSTSLGEAAFSGKDAILHLRMPEGTPALYMDKVSAFGGSERELLLGRGVSYRVDRVVRQNGQWQIFGEVLAQ